MVEQNAVWITPWQTDDDFPAVQNCPGCVGGSSVTRHKDEPLGPLADIGGAFLHGVPVAPKLVASGGRPHEHRGPVVGPPC